MLCKASGKSKLEEGKKQSRLGSAVYSSKEDSKGKPVRHKNLAIQLEGTLIVALSKMARNGIKEAVLVTLLLPPSLNS